MSTSNLEQPYHCYDDCQPQGCPGHMATLEYQSTSNAYHYKDDRNDFYSTGSEIEAFLAMLIKLSGWRVEARGIIERAGFGRLDGSDAHPMNDYKATIRTILLDAEFRNAVGDNRFDEATASLLKLITEARIEEINRFPYDKYWSNIMMYKDDRIAKLKGEKHE